MDLAGICLAVFVLIAAFLFHRYWQEQDPQARQAEMAQFMKNVSLAGGALVIAAVADGAPFTRSPTGLFLTQRTRHARLRRHLEPRPETHRQTQRNVSASPRRGGPRATRGIGLQCGRLDGQHGEGPLDHDVSSNHEVDRRFGCQRHQQRRCRMAQTWVPEGYEFFNARPHDHRRDPRVQRWARRQSAVAGHVPRLEPGRLRRRGVEVPTGARVTSPTSPPLGKPRSSSATRPASGSHRHPVPRGSSRGGRAELPRWVSPRSGRSATTRESPHRRRKGPRGYDEEDEHGTEEDSAQEGQRDEGGAARRLRRTDRPWFEQFPPEKRVPSRSCARSSKRPCRRRGPA